MKVSFRQLSDFTSCVWTLEGTWSLVGILSGDLLWFALYTCLYGGVVGYEQIANTGPLYTVNVVLTSIDRGVPRPVLRFCSRVFPLEVSANSTLNAGVGYLLWNHGPLKHRRAERQLPHPLPFMKSYFQKVKKPCLGCVQLVTTLKDFTDGMKIAVCLLQVLVVWGISRIYVNFCVKIETIFRN